MRKRKARPPRRLILIAGAVILVILIIILMTALRSNAPEVVAPEESPTLSPDTSEIVDSTKPIVTAPPSSTPEPTPEPESLGEFILTAYCPCVKCCGEWSAEHPSRVGTDYIQKTASGTIPTEGRTIGVDTSVIPFGTTVIVFGHEYVAEDRGGAIKGNRIDIYFESHEEALIFGRQTAEVFIKNDMED